MPTASLATTRNILVDLTLDAVSLCGEGANSRAHIILNKRKENENMPTTFEELLKSLKPEHTGLIEAHLKTLAEQNEATVKSLQEELEELSKKIPETPPTDPVIKDLPEEVQKKFTSMQATIEALVNKQAEDLAQQRFDKCKALPVEEAVLKDVLKAASPAVADILEKAAAALIEKTHTPAGSDIPGAFSKATADANYEKLEKAAHKIMEENTSLSFEQAFTKAVEQNPMVYTNYVEGVK